MNYRDYQNNGKKELTSSTPTPSINPDLIGWLFSPKKHTCEVMDSYGLPLRWYKPSDIVEWVFENFEIVRSNAVTLQEMNSQSCGQYALMYLKAKARGQSMQDFISVFKKGDFVFNDHLVGEMIKPLLNSRVENLKCCKQDNNRSCPLDI